jgi:hypothetical protein
MNHKSMFLAAFALVSDPKTWTQGISARDANGEYISEDEKAAVSFCSLGAINRTGFDVGAYAGWLSQSLNRFCIEHRGRNIADYNDSHTHVEVVTLWREFGEACGWLD